MKRHIIVQAITPEIARTLLSKNTSNRRINKATVAIYVQAMSDGDWRTIGDPIRVSKCGVLLDGQHRLLAVIESGVTIYAPLIDDLELDDRTFMDLGQKRTVADHFTILGKPNTHILSAAIRNLMVLAAKNPSVRVTPAIADRVIETHPQLEEIVSRATKMMHMPGSAVAAVCYIGTHVHGEAGRAQDFLEVLKSGVPSRIGDPAHAFREKMILTRTRSRVSRLEGPDVLYTLLYAWELFMKGKTSGTKMQWRTPSELKYWTEAELFGIARVAKPAPPAVVATPLVVPTSAPAAMGA